jgi:hypothetical protein
MNMSQAHCSTIYLLFPALYELFMVILRNFYSFRVSLKPLLNLLSTVAHYHASVEDNGHGDSAQN